MSITPAGEPPVEDPASVWNRFVEAASRLLRSAPSAEDVESAGRAFAPWRDALLGALVAPENTEAVVSALMRMLEARRTRTAALLMLDELLAFVHLVEAITGDPIDESSASSVAGWFPRFPIRRETCAKGLSIGGIVSESLANLIAHLDPGVKLLLEALAEAFGIGKELLGA